MSPARAAALVRPGAREGAHRIAGRRRSRYRRRAPPAAAVAARPRAGGGHGPQRARLEPRRLAADDHDAVEGVDFETWVAVEAGLVRDRVKPADHDVYAGRHGVALGTWDAARSGWQQRMMRDPRLGARYGAEYQAALKRR